MKKRHKQTHKIARQSTSARSAIHVMPQRPPGAGPPVILPAATRFLPRRHCPCGRGATIWEEGAAALYPQTVKSLAPHYLRPSTSGLGPFPHVLFR